MERRNIVTPSSNTGNQTPSPDLPGTEADVTPNPLVGVTLKPWRVELKLMRLAVLIANRHLDLRQTLFVEYLIFRNHLVDEQQIGRQRVHLIGSQSPLQPEWHAAIDEIPHYRRMRRA